MSQSEVNSTSATAGGSDTPLSTVTENQYGSSNDGNFTPRPDIPVGLFLYC